MRCQRVMLNYGSETDFSVLDAISSDELLRESSSVKNLCKCWESAPFLLAGRR